MDVQKDGLISIEGIVERTHDIRTARLADDDTTLARIKRSLDLNRRVRRVSPRRRHLERTCTSRRRYGKNRSNQTPHDEFLSFGTRPTPRTCAYNTITRRIAQG